MLPHRLLSTGYTLSVLVSVGAASYLAICNLGLLSRPGPSVAQFAPLLLPNSAIFSRASLIYTQVSSCLGVIRLLRSSCQLKVTRNVFSRPELLACDWCCWREKNSSSKLLRTGELTYLSTGGLEPKTLYHA